MSIKTRKFADDEFVRVRDNMKDYTEEIRKKIIDNKVDDVHIDMISLNEYVKRNVRMQKFIADIAEISHAEISEINPDSYIVQLKFLSSCVNIRTRFGCVFLCHCIVKILANASALAAFLPCIVAKTQHRKFSKPKTR